MSELGLSPLQARSAAIERWPTSAADRLCARELPDVLLPGVALHTTVVDNGRWPTALAHWAASISDAAGTAEASQPHFQECLLVVDTSLKHGVAAWNRTFAPLTFADDIHSPLSRICACVMLGALHYDRAARTLATSFGHGWKAVAVGDLYKTSFPFLSLFSRALGLRARHVLHVDSNVRLMRLAEPAGARSPLAAYVSASMRMLAESRRAMWVQLHACDICPQPCITDKFRVMKAMMDSERNFREDGEANGSAAQAHARWEAGSARLRACLDATRGRMLALEAVVVDTLRVRAELTARPLPTRQRGLHVVPCCPAALLPCCPAALLPSCPAALLGRRRRLVRGAGNRRAPAVHPPCTRRAPAVHPPCERNRRRYAGVVRAVFEGQLRPHFVVYDDGDEQYYDLSHPDEKWRLEGEHSHREHSHREHASAQEKGTLGGEASAALGHAASISSGAQARPGGEGARLAPAAGPDGAEARRGGEGAAAGAELVGRRVEVYWAGDRRWYAGVIRSHDARYAKVRMTAAVRPPRETAACDGRRETAA